MLDHRFSQTEEGGFVTIRTAVPRACLCVHEGNDCLIFRNMRRKRRGKEDLIVLCQVFRQE